MEKPEQPVVPDEPEVRVLEENFFYEEDHVETTLSDSKVSRDSTAFQYYFYLVNCSVTTASRSTTYT
jgi:hypothetical protein